MKTCFWIILVFSSALAFGAIPPSEFQIKKVIQSRAKLELVRMEVEVTEVFEGTPTGVRFTERMVMHYPSRTMISRVTNSADQDLYSIKRFLGDLVLEAEPAKKLADGTEVPEVVPTVNIDLAKLFKVPFVDFLLFDNQAATLIPTLTNVNIPIRTEKELSEFETIEARRAYEKTGLKRWEGGFAWVIGASGAAGKDSGYSQLWIQKDTFLPVRFVSGDRELHFDRYTFRRSFAYPKRLALLEGSKKILEANVKKLEVSTAKGFQLPVLDGEGLQAAGERANSSLRALLQKYYEFIR